VRLSAIFLFDSVLPAQDRVEPLNIEVAIVDLVPVRTQGVDGPLTQGCDKTRLDGMGVDDGRRFTLAAALLAFKFRNAPPYSAHLFAGDLGASRDLGSPKDRTQWTACNSRLPS
jgi:hypothetical protein